MTHEDVQWLDTLRAADELKRFRGELLVDVFRIWDCDERAWMPDSPVLLRFESDDALVVPGDGGATRIVIGPVATERPPDGTWAFDCSDACRCWLRLDAAPTREDVPAQGAALVGPQPLKSRSFRR